MAIQLIDSVILGKSFGPQEVKAIFDERGVVESWLLFEKTLAKIQGELGMIPAHAGEEIYDKANINHLSLESIERYFSQTGLVSTAVIRAVKEICSHEAREYIHYGATTQDLYDTSLAIRLKRFMSLLIKCLKGVRDSLAQIADKHKGTLMIGRTHGRHAIPITFGFKMAVLVEAFNTHLKRSEEIYPRITIGSLAGAVGTFASFKAISDGNPLELERAVLKELGLNAPIITVQPVIERFCEFLNFLALISVTVEKLAQDIFTLQRDEFAEVVEVRPATDDISSSTMPHKRNPKGCEFIIGLSKLIRSYAHALMESGMKDERDRSAFWVEDIAIPESCILTTTILTTLKSILDNLRVDPEAMLRNASLTKGLVMSENMMLTLAKKTGKKESAYSEISESALKALESDMRFENALLERPGIMSHLTADELREALSLSNYLGIAKEAVETVLKSRKA
jgi:adenylosuccinate lyase